MRCQSPAEGRARGDDPGGCFLEQCVCQILESRKGRHGRAGHTLTGPAVTPGMMCGRRKTHTRGEGCGCAGGTGNPLCTPSLHSAFPEPREEKDLPSTLGV